VAKKKKRLPQAHAIEGGGEKGKRGLKGETIWKIKAPFEQS